MPPHILDPSLRRKGDEHPKAISDHGVEILGIPACPHHAGMVDRGLMGSSVPGQHGQEGEEAAELLMANVKCFY